MRLDTHYACNLNCSYCYVSRECAERATAMPIDMATDLIDQARDLRVRSIVYLGGGEPLLYADFWLLLEHARAQDVVPVVFTNGTLVSKQVARRLRELDVTVIIKFDGFEQTQDLLTGRGSFRRIHAGFEALMEAGFANSTEGESRLGAAPCACRVNYREIPEIWRFLRHRGVFPNVERATTVGGATPDTVLDRAQTRWLYETLREIDETEFGYEWAAPYSAIPGHSCFVCIAGCHVRADGQVCLCPELPPVAHLSTGRLREILRMPAFLEARSLEKRIDEACATCEHFRFCAGGCRSKAYYSGGAITARDPFCFVSVCRGKANTHCVS